VEKVAEKMKPHKKAREMTTPQYKGKRVELADASVPWSKDVPSYNPQDFTDDFVLTEGVAKGWADPPTPHEVPDLMQRKTYEGPIRFDAAGVPLNPRGRTGVRGRGLLGKWGPNHAADPIVTRHHPQTGKLQMVAIKRKDTSVWAIPGGMVDAGETVGDTLRREFAEEAGAHMDQNSKAHFDKLTTELFAKGELVYRGCE
jgi:ADP-ribose pyrophosphatase